MNDRAVALFENYDLTIKNTRKGRGAIIAETEQGVVSLVEYNGPAENLLVQETLLQKASERFDGPLDLLVRTAEGELFCSDYEGKRYIVKHYIEGQECSVFDAVACEKAAKALAHLHIALRKIDFPEEIKPLGKSDNLREDFDRRTAELIRTRNFIRKSPHKEEFELMFLSAYERYLEQATLAYSFLDRDCLEKLGKKQQEEKMMVHGDCTHHNVLFAGEGVTFINFEKTGAHLQTKDVYLFMRKILEKNDWSYELALKVLSAYETVLPLEKEEKIYLYARFLYPEKFWKIANGYLNRRKSVPSRRQQEKLTAFEQKEEKRHLFLNKWLETCR